MCVVCTPDKYVNDFLKSKCADGKVLLALNVGQDQKSKSVMESDKENIGHSWQWTSKKNYYIRKMVPIYKASELISCIFLVCTCLGKNASCCYTIRKRSLRAATATSWTASSPTSKLIA